MTRDGVAWGTFNGITQEASSLSENDDPFSVPSSGGIRLFLTMGI